MDQTTVSLMGGVVGLVSTFVVAVLQIKKADRERYEKTRDDWGEVHRLQKEHIGALEVKVNDLQGELNQALERVGRIQQRSDTWNQRNAELYEHVKRLREQIEQMGGDPGSEPNGYR